MSGAARMNVMDKTGEMPERAGGVIRTEAQPVCQMCGASGDVLHDGLTDRCFGVSGSWRIRRCSNASCGLAWLDPVPVPSDIAKAYENYYTHGEGPQQRSLFSRVLFRVLGLERERNALEWYGQQEARPGRLLEIGFGDARRLMAFRDRGWDVEGQEIDNLAVEKARASGIKAHQGALHDIALESNSFDVVVGSHVIEHVYDPLAMLRECLRLLKPGGRLVMITPNVDGYGHRVFGRDWRGLEVPRHLHLFSQGTIERLATQAGFAAVASRTTAARSAVLFGECLALKQDKIPPSEVPLTAVMKIQVAGHLLAARVLGLLGIAGADELVLEARSPE